MYESPRRSGRSTYSPRQSVNPGTRWSGIASRTSQAPTAKSVGLVKDWVLSSKALGRMGNWPITGPSEMREPKALRVLYHKGFNRHCMLLRVCCSSITLTDCRRKQQTLQVQIQMLKRYAVFLHLRCRWPKRIDGFQLISRHKGMASSLWSGTLSYGAPVLCPAILSPSCDADVDALQVCRGYNSSLQQLPCTASVVTSTLRASHDWTVRDMGIMG